MWIELSMPFRIKCGLEDLYTGWSQKSHTVNTNHDGQSLVVTGIKAHNIQVKTVSEITEGNKLKEGACARKV